MFVLLQMRLLFNCLFQVRFLSDLVNCHVLVAASLLQMFDNFIEVTLEDNIPQVSLGSLVSYHLW